MSQSAIYALGTNIIWLLDGDGTPIDFGVPYAPPVIVTTVMPTNSTALEMAVAEVGAWRTHYLDVDVIRRVHRADECPEPFLPILAWEYSVDEWDPEWTGQAKRQAIKQSYDLHRHKGTAYAVEQAVGALAAQAKVEEWFEYGGSPYRFRVAVNLSATEPWTGNRANQIVRVALRAKNVRSRMESIHLRRPTRIDGPYVGAFVQSRVITSIIPEVPTEITVSPYIYVGALVSIKSRTTIKPAG